MALGLQAVQLLRDGSPVAGDAFCTARLGERTQRCYGTLPDSIDAEPLIARSLS